MFKQNLDLSLSTKVTTVAHDKGSYVCPVQFLPTRHSSVLLGPSVVSVAPPMQIKTPGGQIRKKEKKKKRLYYGTGGYRDCTVEAHGLDLTPRLKNLAC